MPTNPDTLRGHLDLILLTILEHEPLYGLRVAQEAQARTDGYFDFKEGSLYPALHRLERDGLLEAELREMGRNGKPRKYYKLTDRGQHTLEAKRKEWEAFTGAVAAVRGAR